jgi:tetratricopeptide (TPR) repeat protein
MNVTAPSQNQNLIYRKQAVGKKIPTLRVFRENPWVMVGIITLLGAFLRLFGILHGLQENFLYHPDTHITLNEVWPKFVGENWLKKSYNGPFYDYFISQVIGFSESLIQFLGRFPSPWSIEEVAALASFFAALLGTATIPVVYLIGVNSFNRMTGTLAALLTSLCPLQTLHSHYPYRDVPMVFFLALTLFFSLRIIKKPNLLNIGLGGLTALLTVGLKPAGILVLIPLFVALGMGLWRVPKWWTLLPIGVLIGLGIIFLAMGGISSRFETIAGFYNFLLSVKGGLFQGMGKEIRILVQWLGYPYLITTAAGIFYGVWRRKSEDLLLLSFFIPAFLGAGFYQSLDDRFLVFLLPVMAVMVSRFFAELWQAFLYKVFFKWALFLLVAFLCANALMESIWQGLLFSLPDTRAVSARWLEAHVPKQARVATEGYYPIGLNLWPNVSYLNSGIPLDQVSRGQDILVTSSLEHQRFFDDQDRYPQEVAFFRSLQKNRPLLKKFSLERRGFIQSDIDIYSPYPIESRPIQFILPRPYDSKWNFGLSFLDQGPLDKDDRTIELAWGHRYKTTLVSPQTGQEMMIFLLNGTEESRVKVRLGFTTKIRKLKPGELHLLTFKPRWIFPKKPAFYHFEAGLSEGKKVLVQLRCGNREIGDALAKWGFYDRAVPYLQKAIAEDDPHHPEVSLLLGSIYEKIGKKEDARQIVIQLSKSQPQYISTLRSLGQEGLSSEDWSNRFRDLTALNPFLLAGALSKDFSLSEAFPSRSGMVVKDCRAADGQVIAFDTSHVKPDEVMHGPYIHLDKGVYRACFFIRSWDLKGTGPFMVIKVLADDKVISALSVKDQDLKGRGNYFKEIWVPFSHPNTTEEIKFQVFATGKASFSIEKIRIEPDLQEWFKKKKRDLETLTGK